MRLDEKEVDMRELRVSEVTFKVIKLLKRRLINLLTILVTHHI